MLCRKRIAICFSDVSDRNFTNKSGVTKFFILTFKYATGTRYIAFRFKANTSNYGLAYYTLKRLAAFINCGQYSLLAFSSVLCLFCAYYFGAYILLRNFAQGIGVGLFIQLNAM